LNLANDNDPTINTDAAKRRAEKAIIELLEGLDIDWRRDPNTKKTPHRVAKMYVDELLRGRFEDKPACTVFPNTLEVDQLYTVGPIPVSGVCSHHFLPITGYAWVGIIPSEHLLGLSKFARLAQWVFARPQIQEEATQQLADLLDEVLDPVGVGVVCKADHACMSLRGVKSHGTKMVTSTLLGQMKKPDAKSEFMEFVRGTEF